jgi:glycosyltransferase involved in cell wall biosynthesis
MIKVLHFAGIINRHDIIDSFLTRLDRSGFQVLAVAGMPARRSEVYLPFEEYPTRVLNFEFSKRSYPRMMSALLREIWRFQPHVLHAHHYHENMIASLAVRLSRVPCYVIGRHYSDGIHMVKGSLKRNALLSGESFCNRTASMIAVPTRAVADLLAERQGVPRSKIAVIPNGLDFKRYAPSSPEAAARLRLGNSLSDKYMAVVCCRFSLEKGLKFLIKAVPELRARYPHFRLVLVGGGPCEPDLRRMVSGLGITDTVQFAGWRSDALDWIAAADVVVQPSLSESFCQTLVEAVAFGKPVVMTPVGFAPELIGRNERGRLVPVADSTALVSAISELIEDRELARRLGESGRIYLQGNMSPDRTARSYEALYGSLTRSTGR